MSDDLREREPQRDQADLPAEEGTRSDHAGTGTGVHGPAPAGGDPERIAGGPAADREPRSEAGRTASGGYGTPSGEPGAGTSGESTQPTGGDDQTDWLRSEEEGRPSR
jgi:hypothetical protein